jgi:hypothetical protein
MELAAGEARPLAGFDEWADGDEPVAEDDGEVRDVASQPPPVALGDERERTDDDGGTHPVDIGDVARDRMSAALQDARDPKRGRAAAIERDGRTTPVSRLRGREQHGSQPREQGVDVGGAASGGCERGEALAGHTSLEVRDDALLRFGHIAEHQHAPVDTELEVGRRAPHARDAGIELEDHPCIIPRAA